MVYSCDMCIGNRVPFVAREISTILNHYGRYHRHDSNFFVACKVRGCGASYRTFEGFKSHIRRHKDITIQNDVPEVIDDINGYEEHNEQPVYEEAECEQAEPEIDFKKQNALFLLKTKEVYQMSQKAATTLISDTTSLIQSCVEQVEDKVKDCLNNAGIQFENIPGLKGIFSSKSEVTNPFHGITTKSEQNQYFVEEFGLVEPIRHVFGHHHAHVRAGTKRKRVAKPDEMILVPLLKSLEAMLNDPSVMKEIEQPHFNTINNGRIYDYCDSEACKLHPLFSRDPSALQIILYFDEVECVNPLGSKTKKHKLGFFYYTLGNILPRHRSQLKAIQLLAIVKRTVMNKYGVNAVLKPIMAEISELESDNGHEFIISGRKRTLRGSIAFVSGDNLGLQELGGFKVGPGANCKCRECMGLADEIKRLFCEENFQLRTAEEHDNHCSQIEEEPELSSSYGVNFASALCHSRYFHVIGGLPGDAMHDVLEGCLQYECKELLKYLIYERRFLTLNQLNSGILNFDYGYQNDTDKPSPISELTMHSPSNTLHQRAAQMWCLARFLPLIIGAKVPEVDEHWQLFLKMLEIADVIFSPVASYNQASYLAVLIEEHHAQFKRIYPNCSIIPKMHYLIHYPRAMIRLGPMTTSWCMRFEAKHQYFKKLAAGLGNFKNLPLTLATRHQNKQCYTKFNAHKPTECGPGKLQNAGTTNYFPLIKKVFPEVIMECDVTEFPWISVCGSKYKTGAVVHIGFHNLLPIFAIISKIIIVRSHSSKPYFVVEVLDTLSFNEHYHSYQVQRLKEKSLEIYSQADLITFPPMNITSPLGATGLYVNMKYDVDLLNLN